MLKKDSEIAAASATVTIQFGETAWTKGQEKEFLSLVKKSATQTITREEEQDLKSMQAERRRIHHARTGDEVITEYTQRRVAARLVDALEEYVRFHSAASRG